MALEASTPEPIAVIGIGCRVAGNVANPADFWNFLLEGRSHITEVPQERWEPYLRRDPRNAAILRETLDVLPSGWGGTLLIATNPVDQLCMLARRVLSPEATVLGYTLNDSLRLAQSIALEIGCHPSRVG
nr:beta-ketoacyl synthase N-terminal-like domain-containing protein [Streptomyces sp. DSM 41633]